MQVRRPRCSRITGNTSVRAGNARSRRTRTRSSRRSTRRAAHGVCRPAKAASVARIAHAWGMRSRGRSRRAVRCAVRLHLGGRSRIISEMAHGRCRPGKAANAVEAISFTTMESASWPAQWRVSGSPTIQRGRVRPFSRRFPGTAVAVSTKPAVADTEMAPSAVDPGTFHSSRAPARRCGSRRLRTAIGADGEVGCAASR